MKGFPEHGKGEERGHAASLAAATARGVTRGVAGGARAGGRMARGTVSSVAERLFDTAPRIPVRSLATLRRQFPGLDAEQIADRLTAAAVRGTMTVGAGVGAAAMLPTPPAMPAEIASETLGVALVEYKLIAELHEVYGQRVQGTVRDRATSYLWAWSEQRGINALRLSTMGAAVNSGMKREVRQRLVRRTIKHTPALTPFMIGAAVGAVMNRRDTRKLARRVRRDLRAHQIPWSLLPASDELPALEEPLDALEGPLPSTDDDGDRPSGTDRGGR
ncbi:hypothetical protein [Actinacidiphila yeochonensis]|uniref:hypothetical protein n=1 Tax=Actinacidiphila yeochonensis TaxID=89050 RepID=UPI0007C71EB5|nr:hypothetical protein [Actinacidiphila yeochonensis]